MVNYRNEVRGQVEKSPSREGSGRPVTDPMHIFYLAMLHEFLTDPRKLLEWHDEARGASGRPKRDLEVLKRAAVILAVTSWETFIEDVLRWTLEDRLRMATNPRELLRAFSDVARERMKRGNDLDDHHEHLAEWSVDKWKDVVQGALKQDLDRFHNPNSAKSRRMYKKYLEVDVTAKWNWRGVTSQRACEQLDALLRLRGKLTHSASGKGLFFEPKAAVRLEDAAKAITLVERLGQCTLMSLPAYRT
jgi:HEPN superfamily RiboL-PSP-like protein